MTITTSSHQAGAETGLTISVPIAPLNLRHYGAQINLPGALRIQYPAYGDSSQQCPAGPRVRANSPMTPAAWSFTPTGCPATAVIGTATLGAATGTIYMVNESPLPQMGVYFDRGVTTPFGRRISVTYTGSAPTFQVAGLPFTASRGLTLDFDAPSRPTLTGRIWEWASAGASECVASPQATGTAWLWPTRGTVATKVAITPVNLALRGCDIGFLASAPPNQASASTPLRLAVTLPGSGPDARLYGAKLGIPRSIVMSFPAFGTPAQECPDASLSADSTGLTPAGRSFDPTDCPATAQIGTADLGGVSGRIYLIASGAYSQMGVAFDDIDAPYGRELNWTFDGDGASWLTVMGLENRESTGLTLTFDNPGRAGGLGNLWHFVQPTDSFCRPLAARATVYTYPTSGTVATPTSERWSYVPVNGCTG